MKHITTAFFLAIGCAQATTVALNPSFDAYVRSDGNANGDDDTHNNINELIVGRVLANEWIRPIMQFDLSSIPDGATINSVTLTMYIGSLDTGTAGASTNSLGADGLQLVQMSTDADFANKFTWNDQSWGANGANGGGDDVPWTTPGGDFNSTVLSSIANNVIPIKTVSSGDSFTLASSSDFVNAISSNLGDDTVQLMLRTPGIESGFNERKLIRFASSEFSNTAFRPSLTIDYTAVPEPSSAMLGGLGLLALVTRRKRG
ncbi:MAG: DNRLRE domain-containing protein [Akkermansiaceae bacterium]